MILYLTDNLLKAHRVLKLNEHQYCPAREDGLASIEAGIENVRALISARINFILEFGTNESPPESMKHMNLQPHPDAKALNARWLVPPYWKPEVPVFDIEYRATDGELKYKSKLSLKAFDKAMTEGMKVTRVFSETGLTEEFLNKYKLRLMSLGKFRYAAPPAKLKARKVT